MSAVRRFLQARRNMSGISFWLFFTSSPFRKLQRKFAHRTIAKIDSLEDRFTLIYRRNAWGSKESVSGNGSTLASTESIRRLLPVLIKRFDIKSIFDAPCGDFNWMRLVELQDVIYIGGDIVTPLVDYLSVTYSSESVNFMQIDITMQSYAEFDLVLNRDCLFHLSYMDIFKCLEFFLDSRSKYFLSTSHVNQDNFENVDIRSGDFRIIDLFSTPFKFPSDAHFEIPEFGEGSLPPRKLYLWDRDQVQVAHTNLGIFLSGL